MKRNNTLGTGHKWFSFSTAIVALAMIFALPSCQNDEGSDPGQDSAWLKNLELAPGVSLYFDHKTFTRTTAAPFAESVTLTNVNYNCYDNLVLKIRNGGSKNTRVSSAEITIDGVVIAGPSDFNKNVTLITKPIAGLTSESVLMVKLNSAPGSFIDLWIEGNLNLTQPEFTLVGSVLQGAVAPVLPLVSNNGITGTWEPEAIDTSVPGFFTFTFTPDGGQCASTAEIAIGVIDQGIIYDAQRNAYRTVIIGTQTWMTDNLRSTVFNNGDPIVTTTPTNLDLTLAENPAYQWNCKDNEIYANAYGKLYTWYAVSDSRGICPAGWHLPNNAEWTTLATYLTDNGYGFGGSGNDIAKALASTGEWTESSIPGTPGNDPQSNNSSGFNAIPGGFRSITGVFQDFGNMSAWWSADKGQYRVLSKTVSEFTPSGTSEKYGLSVRCVKN